MRRRAGTWSGLIKNYGTELTVFNSTSFASEWLLETLNRKLTKRAAIAWSERANKSNRPPSQSKKK
jgi:hypothetical protein